MFRIQPPSKSELMPPQEFRGYYTLEFQIQTFREIEANLPSFDSSSPKMVEK